MLAELDDAREQMNDHRHALRQLGVSLEAEARAGGVGCGRISTTGRLWQPDPAGFPALILGCWQSEPPSIYSAETNFVLVDLVSFQARRPDVWHYRRGVPFATLGSHLLQLAHECRQPITLHPTPLEWLRAECRGACLLEWAEHALEAA